VVIEGVLDDLDKDEDDDDEEEEDPDAMCDEDGECPIEDEHG